MPNGETGKKSVEDRDDLIFELIKRSYDSTLQNIHALDTKAASLIGFVSVVVGLIAGVGGSEMAKSYILSILYFTSLALLLTSISFGLKAFREKRNYFRAPDVKVLLKKYTKPTASYSDVLQTSGNAMIIAMAFAESSNSQKAVDINRSWIFLLAGLGSVLALLVFLVFGSQIGTYFENLIKPLLDIISTYAGERR